MKLFSLPRNTRVKFIAFFALEISFGIPPGLPLVTKRVDGTGRLFWGLKMFIDLRSAHLV